jgi:CDP-2,3-bis-(O-geranylgeranyl)-sn-glycerol synthase
VTALVRALHLVYFMLPAYAANMAPPFLRFWPGWNPPLSRRWLGAHKTTLGFAAGVLAAVAVTFLQSRAGLDGGVTAYDRWLSLGLRFGAGAMLGDVAKSFAKRRVGIAPGRRWIPFDQLDFAAGALLAVASSARLAAADVLLVLALTFAGHVTVNRLGYLLGIRDTPW